MSNDKEFDFWYAVNNTKLVTTPTSKLETFGDTIVNYSLICDDMDNVNKICIKEGQIKALKPTIITPNKAIPNLWKSNKLTSKDEINPTGISTEASQIKLDNDEIGVINITVNKAAERTANGYFAILIIIPIKLLLTFLLAHLLRDK